MVPAWCGGGKQSSLKINPNSSGVGGLSLPERGHGYMIGLMRGGYVGLMDRDGVGRKMILVEVVVQIDANEIVTWAGTWDAAGQLPNIVRQLILATGLGLSESTVPGGSSVRQPGWDGIVIAGTENVWVPEGRSVWELSCDANVVKKANDDYEKRTGKPVDWDRSQITYVAVTARRFNRKGDWVEERREEGVWRDVKVVDADTLVAWLEVAPVVSERFARLIGRLPDGGYMSLQEWWDGWVFGTSPSVTPGLVLAGRRDESAELGRWFRDSPAGIYVQGYTQDEAISFVAASALEYEGEWGAEFLPRALVVNTPDAWRDLCGLSSPLVLIRDFNRESVAVATERGNHTLVPLAETERKGGDGIILPRLGREETTSALVDMGLSENEAYALSWKTGRRLPIIRRQIVDAPGLAEPAWSTLSTAGAIAPLVLLGQWEDDHAGDQEAVARLTGESYDVVQRQVVELAGLAGSPVKKIGNRWRFLCQEDSWHMLASKLSGAVLNRFGDLALSSLGARGVDDAAVGGAAVPSVSETLRRGITQGMVVMALNPEKTLYEAECAMLVRRVVTSVLSGDGVWTSLGRDLVLLAEAGPEEFMSAVESTLNVEPSPFKSLFRKGDGAWLMPYQSGYLFSAMEALAWCPEYFGRVSRLMSRVAALAGGESDPDDSVKRVVKLFAAGISFTEASDEARWNALERLVKNDGHDGWRVLCAAFPTGRDLVIETPGPLWRPWGSGGPRRPNGEEFIGYVDELERMLVENVGTEPRRWVSVLDLLWYLRDEAREKMVSLLRARAPGMAGCVDSIELWHALRQKVAWFRMHADNEHAIPADRVEDLERVYGLLVPEDCVVRNSWKFDFWPWGYEKNFLELSVEEQEKETREARGTAVREVYEGGSGCAVFALAGEARVPELVGLAVAEGLDRESGIELALSQLGSQSTKLRAFARAVLSGVYGQNGWDGLGNVLGMVRDLGGDREALADVFLSARGAGETWERLSEEATPVRDAYWRDIGRWDVRPENLEELGFAAEQLLDRDRGMTAIELLAYSDLELDQRCVDVAVRALTLEPQRSGSDERRSRADGSYIYNIVRLLEKLDDAPGVLDAEIAVLEMPYVGELDRYDRKVKVYREVIRDPGVFGALVARCSVRDDGQADYLDYEGERSMVGVYSARVLLELKNLPGESPEGVVDAEKLVDWVTEARKVCSELGCLRAADRRIGALLANSPEGSDGVWPCEPVRDLLDAVESGEMRRCFVSGVRSLRGVSQRGLFDGGDQERNLAERYRYSATNLLARWPVTASLLRKVAESYDSYAGWHDERAEWFDLAGF